MATGRSQEATCRIVQDRILELQTSGWPDEQAMTEAIQVELCERSSVVFRQNWNSSMTYNLKRKIRGRAIIINNTNFVNEPPRMGTEKDRDRLKILFHELHFVVIIHEDKSAKEIKNILAAEAGDPYHGRAECLILVILSHGTTTGISGVDGNVVSLEDITRPFESDTCPNLAGKPKIFLIQACLGGNTDQGGKLNAGPDISNIGEILKKTKDLSLNEQDSAVKYPSSENRIPTKQDILIASATHPGFVAMRNILYGSWFIQAVICVFQRYACQEELSCLLKMVNHLVSKGRAGDSLQAAHYSDSFIKKFYFFPGCYDYE